MEIKELFIGSAGRVFSSSCIIIIVSLLFIVSVRLFLSRRKKAYFSLTVSLIIIIMQYLLLIAFELRGKSNTYTLEYVTQLLHVFAFLLINTGIFQLYNVSKRREFRYFLLFFFVAVFIAIIRFYRVGSEVDPSLHFIRMHDIWIELYLLLLTFLGFYLILPFIGQRLKYQIALTVYFIVQLAHIINRYFLGGDQGFLSIVENFLPIVFYAVIFMMTFDRVVEILQAVYNSSIKDGLTGLYNRPFFYNRVADFISQGVKVSVLFMDIDNFKKLNDTKGHQMGDKILKQVAGIVQEVGQSIGICGRYGGEEIVFLLTDPSYRAESVAETIRRRIEEETLVTVSIGYSRHRSGVTPNDLITEADQAMYNSKRTGKNKVSPYIPY